jgi:hypothetical protein
LEAAARKKKTLIPVGASVGWHHADRPKHPTVRTAFPAVW